MFQFDTILQLVTLIALIAGILFGILEIRRAAKLRTEKAALDVFEITIQSEQIVKGKSVFISVPY